MRKKILGVLLLTFTYFIAAQEYKLVWEDNFNNPTLDKSIWTSVVSGNGGGNKELQYYRKENISVGKEPVSGESCLIITAKKEAYKKKPATSGRLSTEGKMTLRYGKVVGRIKMAHTSNGLWPAFWMLGSDSQKAIWPKCGEIDIVEMGHKKGIIAGTQDRFFNGACHWGESWNGGSYPNKGISTTNPYSLQDGFHTYTLIWTPDSIKMYLDLDKFPNSKPYYDIPITGTNLPNQTSRYFRKPFYLIFNLAVGGTFSELYDINEISALKNGEAKMYVDYVRLYQKMDGNDDFYLLKRK
jgi:beta-glucanase (GH16 family)